MADIMRVEKVSRSFGSGNNKIPVLKNIDIVVEQGTLTILRGRSGSGKTTLLNLLSALDMPTSGEIFFEDKDITKLPDRKRDELRRTKYAFVFQSVALIGNMTAYENVDFALRVAHYPSKDRDKRVREALDLVGLVSRMKHRVQELSGGEQQRVAIARAIAGRPSIIFADEPTAELDSNMGEQIMRLFRKVVETEKITVIMTTHDPHLMKCADRVYLLEDGVVIG
jgi:putative ABC transport system ATP-binding protein